jgi:endonuclease I
VLNGTSDVVFEPWVINMLKRWHQNDPVDAIERARNDAAFNHQGNRNPYIDHPEFVNAIW